MPKSKMAAMNRKYMYNTYVLACVPDSNEIPTAKPMFSRPGNTERLVKIFSDVLGLLEIQDGGY